MYVGKVRFSFVDQYELAIMFKEAIALKVLAGMSH